MRRDSIVMAIGRNISPSLKLVRLIGEGGMGTVWAAEHQVLGSQVAVKMLAQGYLEDEKSIARFKQEAQRAAKVRSPHVATVFDHGMTAEKEPYIVMELLEGETLGDRIKRLGCLPLHEIESVIGQMAKALTAAHKLGVVHRDIKPSNLFLVDNEGEPFVKVLDFGIAKQMDVPPDLTTSSMLVGTPAYMSPEQYMHPKTVDARTDLWALGIVVYEALTGKRPFTGETPMAVALAITKGRYHAPSQTKLNLPAMIDGWMAQALALDPNKRFRSAAEMIEALGKALRSAVRHANTDDEMLPFNATVPVPRPQIQPESVDEATIADKTVRDIPINLGDLKFFEGCWRSKQGWYYFRVVQNQLHAAYSFSNNDQLDGVIYDCQVIEYSLYARFRWPSKKHLSGCIVLHAQFDDTLIGGWWSQSQVPPEIESDLTQLNAKIPGMEAVTYRRVQPTPRFPEWAERQLASIAARVEQQPRLTR